MGIIIIKTSIIGLCAGNCEKDWLNKAGKKWKTM